jgi:hypothetical protein
MRAPVRPAVSSRSVRRRAGTWVLATAAAVVLTATAAPAQSASAQVAPGFPPAAVTPAQATALGQQAYLYGLPLLEFLRVRRTMSSVRCPDGRGNAPLNAFSHATRFATPSDRTVVLPNVDTLYSLAQVDLGNGPVVLSHPGMGHRYFVFELLDPYTNVIGYVGTRTTGSRAGRFALTWSGHPGRRVRAAHVIRSPTRRVWVVGRTLAGGRADQRRALRLMRRFELAPPGGPRHFAAGCRPGRPVQATTPNGLAFLDALGTAMKRNPPPARDQPLLRRLAQVGVGPGLRPERAGLPPATLAALTAGVTATAAILPTQARALVLDTARDNHGWAIPRPETGVYGTDYTYRAGVAFLGLGANTPEEAMYPTALTDANGALLDGAQRYRMVIPKGQEPPGRGFWSLTIYDAAGFLVANPEHRYAIGDSHPGLVRRPDGSIVVVLQRTRPTEAGVNWLPTPPGAFRLNLRLYQPSARALSGAWQPAPVEPVAP